MATFVRRHPTIAVGGVLIGIMVFIAAFAVLRDVIRADPDGWRAPWAGIGCAVAGTAVPFLLLVRARAPDDRTPVANAPGSRGGYTLGRALRSPTFWVFALATSFYGLVAAVWTRDVKLAHRLAGEIKAGSVWINTYNGFDTGSPFGGYKQSGFGRDLGAYALDQYTNIKSVWIAL